MKTIDLVYFDAGGGHRAAAQALAETIREQQRPWCVRLVNLFELLDPEQHWLRITGFKPEAYYNKRLAKGWTMGLAQELKVLQATVRLMHPWLVKTLARHWATTEPDMVVSLVPNFNRALQESVGLALPGVPFCTVLTDWADFPPRFWMEAEPGADIVCGTPAAVSQALRLGHPAHRVHRVSGMILRPGFYRDPSLDRASWRRAMKLPDDQPVGLVMFGGHGSQAMVTVAQQLPDVPLILMCGHNQDLLHKLQNLKAPATRVVLDYTPQVAELMRMADFFIGKPGPGALSEALHCGLPIVTFRNTLTLPQERFNADLIAEQGLGMVASSHRQVRDATLQLLARRDEFAAKVGSLRNNAASEVVNVLALLLRRSSRTPRFDWPRPNATVPLQAQREMAR
jgi:UDP-N-acetylglucosamine:LPS N-acetylglucosamine transferase